MYKRQVYRFQGIDEEQALLLAQKLLAEEIFQNYAINQPILKNYDALVEVAYKPGVMNPEANSLLKSAKDMGIHGILAADSSKEYAFYGTGATAVSYTHLDVYKRQVYTYARMRRDEDNTNPTYQALTDRADGISVKVDTALSFMVPEICLLYTSFASIAYSPNPLEKRLPLILGMAGLETTKQVFFLEQCWDRDEICLLYTSRCV